MTMNGKKMSGALISLVFCLLVQICPVAAEEAAQGQTPKGENLAAFLNDLGKKVSDFKTLSTDFTQEKQMAMFKDKLVLKGRIYIQKKPNQLAWHVDSPLRYSVLITDTVIRQWDEDTNQVQEVSLAKNPIFQNVLNQLTVWFSGEYGSLLADNTVRLIQQAPLVLEFHPREKNISKKVIKSITITFRADRKYLEELRIKEVNGDVTTLHFKNTLLDVPLHRNSFEVKGNV